MSLGTLHYNITAKTADFDNKMSGVRQKTEGANKSMGDMTKNVEGGTQKMGRSIGGLNDSVKKLAIGFAGAFAATKIIGGIRNMVTALGEKADRLLDLQDITGIATDKLQEYEYVARMAGVNTEALARASEGLTRRMSNATSEASPFNRAMADLGITVRTASGELRSGDKIMDDIIVKLAEMENVTERNMIGQQAFGGAWRDMAPILSMGADGIAEARQEARDLGVVMDKDALNAANEFRQSMERLRVSGQVLGRDVAQALIPVIQRLAENVQAVISWYSNMDEGQQRLIRRVAMFAAAAVPATMALSKMRAGLQAATLAVRALAAAKMATPWGAVAGGIGLAATAYMALRSRTEEVTEAEQARQRVSEAAQKGYAGEAAEVERLTRIVENSNVPLQRRKEAMEELQKIAPGYNGELTKEGELINHNTDALDSYLDALRRKIRLQAQEEEFVKAIEAEIQAEDRLLDKKQELALVQEEQNQILAKYPDVAERSVINNRRLSESEAEATRQYWANQQALEELTGTTKEYQAALRESSRAVNALESDMEDTFRRQHADVFDAMSQSADDFAASIEGLGSNELTDIRGMLEKDLADALHELENAFRGGSERTDEYRERVEMLEKALGVLGDGTNSLDAIMERHAARIDEIKKKNEVWGDGFDEVAAKQSALQSTINALTKEFGPNHEAVIRLKNEYDSLSESTDGVNRGVEQQIGLLGALNEKMRDLNTAETEAMTVGEIARSRARQQATQDEIDQINFLADALVDMGKFKQFATLDVGVPGADDVAMPDIDGPDADQGYLGYLNDLSETLDTLSIKNQVFGDSFDMIGQEIQANEAALRSMIENYENFDVADEEVQRLIERIRELKEEQQGAAASIVDVGQIAEQSLESMGAAFVDMAFGAEQSIGDVIKSLIRMIAMQLVSAAIGRMMGGFGGGGAPDVSSLLAGVQGTVPQMASGGIAKGETLVNVGEYPGASINPEVIAPLDKLKDIMASAIHNTPTPAVPRVMTKGGSMSHEVAVTGQLAGQDIMISNQRAGRRRRLVE